MPTTWRSMTLMLHGSVMMKPIKPPRGTVTWLSRRMMPTMVTMMYASQSEPPRGMTVAYALIIVSRCENASSATLASFQQRIVISVEGRTHSKISYNGEGME